MATLKTSLQKLLPATRKSGRLPAAQDREPIPAGQGVGSRSAATPQQFAPGGGLVSPLTETARTVTAHNDGTHDYYVAVQSTVEDADGAEYVINWLQPGDPGITVV